MRKQSAGTKKTDWVAIREQYVQGGKSCAQLAEEHGVRANTVETRCSRERWRAARSKFVASVEEVARQKSAEAQAEYLVIKNEALGAKWYQLAEAALDDALAAVKPSERQSQAITAGIATEKWRLVTGQTTAKSEQIIKGEYDDLTDEEAEALLAESVEILRYSQQNREAAVSGADAAPGEGG